MPFYQNVKQLFAVFLFIGIISCEEETKQFASGTAIFETEQFYADIDGKEKELSLSDFEDAWRTAIFEETLIEPDFHNYRIEKSSDNNGPTYWLFAEAQNKCIVIATRLMREKDHFKVDIHNDQEICGCTGCEGECTLIFAEGECVCQKSSNAVTTCSGIGAAKNAE